MRNIKENIINIVLKIIGTPIVMIYFFVSWVFKQIGHILELAFGKFKTGIASLVSAGALAYVISLIQ